MERYIKRFANWYKEIGEDYLILILIVFFGSLGGFLVGYNMVKFW